MKTMHLLFLSIAFTFLVMPISPAQATIVDAAHATVTCGGTATELGGRLKGRERIVTVQVPETSGPVTIWIQGTGDAASGMVVEPGYTWSSGDRISKSLKVMCQAVSGTSDVRLVETL